MSVKDLTITSLETITAFDLVSGAYRFTLDELQNAKIANTQEKTDMTGKGGRKLNSLKKNKAVTVSGTNGLLSCGLLELQTGKKFEKKDKAPVKWVDYLTVASDKATTTYKATGTSGNEIERVYVKNSDGTLGTTLEQAATAAEGKFAYAPATKELSFETGKLADGTEIVVYYTREIGADVLSNVSDVYSEKCQLYIDAFAEDMCGVTYRVQIYIPRADFSGNFDIDLGDNQTVHAFEAESLTSSGAGCASGGLASGLLWTYTVFGADAEDAA